MLLADYAADRFLGQRLEIDLVRHRLVGHYRGGVGVDEDDVDARLAQHLARLRAGVVELRRLTYDYRPRTYDKDFFDIFIKRHIYFLPSD